MLQSRQSRSRIASTVSTEPFRACFDRTFDMHHRRSTETGVVQKGDGVRSTNTEQLRATYAQAVHTRRAAAATLAARSPHRNTDSHTLNGRTRAVVLSLKRISDRDLPCHCGRGRANDRIVSRAGC